MSDVQPFPPPVRVQSLVAAALAAGAGEGSASDRLAALLALLARLTRVVLVADEFEGFHGDEAAAQALAVFLSS